MEWVKSKLINKSELARLLKMSQPLLNNKLKNNQYNKILPKEKEAIKQIGEDLKKLIDKG